MGAGHHNLEALTAALVPGQTKEQVRRLLGPEDRAIRTYQRTSTISALHLLDATALPPDRPVTVRVEIATGRSAGTRILFGDDTLFRALEARGIAAPQGTRQVNDLNRALAGVIGQSQPGDSLVERAEVEARIGPVDLVVEEWGYAPEEAAGEEWLFYVRFDEHGALQESFWHAD